MWLILGWGHPVLAGLEWIDTFGKGWQGIDCTLYYATPSKNCAHTFLIFYIMLEYLVTLLVLIFARYPQE